MLKPHDPWILGCPWSTWVGVAVVTTGLALFSWAYEPEKAAARVPYPPSTELCNPAVESCVRVEYLLYRDVAVSSVYVDGVLSHCKEGFCRIGEEYTEYAKYTTPEQIIAVSGCPDLADGYEALDLMREFVAKGSQEARYALGLRDRA